MNKNILIIFVALILIGCSDPLPNERLNYAGEWEGENMYLFISRDGGVEYERKSGSTTTSIDAPLKEFIGDDFVVGILFMDTTFEVSEPPHEFEGKWYMTVDGVRLTRIDD
ncbi:hypothetical protein [Aliikangiella coralliicola]|uniref:Uncharacterized protein n=1 Tax=Aliikangiella coralliicola TaxID=2592383 RepID=A0A545UDR0_9GAMM|nr:hypothetical protein [Aliikangiella coralliicola]TQV87601.1 hypothetical protein FLL46_12075 [Aliikangiella coralliicola]